MEERYCGTTLITVDDRLLPFVEQNSSGHILPGNLEAMNWCRNDRSISLLAPAYYTEIQSKYWSVGFLQYWQWRKIPMFLMALPTLGFILYGAMDFLFGNLNMLSLLIITPSVFRHWNRSTRLCRSPMRHSLFDSIRLSLVCYCTRRSIIL